MTFMGEAKRGAISSEIKYIARNEGISENALARNVAAGKTVILKWKKPLGIGKGLRTKVNTNIGTSQASASIKNELAKLRVAAEAGADTVMDLSTGGNLKEVLKAIIKNSKIPVGTVPVYSAVVSAKGIALLGEDEFLSPIEAHIKLGVSFITVHSALTREGAALARGRLLKIVSRGGCFLAAWMLANKKENPIYKNFDYILEMAKENEVALSLGDALRPGCLKDANDRAQIHELLVQSKLVKRCRAQGVAAICEGPGHMPMNEIAGNIKLQKRLCSGAPYYVLGPLVTDAAVGYDHVAAAIGGAIAGAAGADFLCAVTPSEHISLPNANDIREGTAATRIAAHAADIAKGIGIETDNGMSAARAALDWKKTFSFAVDKKKALSYREWKGKGACTMCGDFCAIKIMKGIK